MVNKKLTYEALENQLKKIESDLAIALSRQSEETLKNSEAKFQIIFDQSPVGSVIVGLDKRFIRCNKAFCNFIGYEENELIGKAIADVTYPEDIEIGMKEMKEIIEGKIESSTVQKRYLRKDEGIVWGEISICLVRDVNKKPLFFLPIIQDISERKQIEEKLIRSEKELIKVQQITHIGIWYLDIATNKVEWTDGLYKMYGFDPTLPPPPYTEHQKLFTPDSWKLLSASLAHTADTGIPYELELNTVKEDGSNGWMWVRGEAITDHEGKIIGLWGAAQDITERKEMEEALRFGNERFQNIFNSLQDAFFQADLSGNFTLISPSASAMYGYESAEEMIGLSAVHLYANPLDREKLKRELSEKGTIKDFLVQARKKDGSVFWASMNAQVTYQNGKISGTEGVVRDITKRKQAENILNELIEKNPMSIQIMNKDGFTQKTNPAFTRLFGSIPPPDFSIFTELESNGFEELISRAKKGEVVHFPDLYYNVHDNYPDHPDKKNCISAVLFPLTDSAGVIERFVFMHENITSRKEVEEKLRQSEEKSKAIVLSTPDHIIMHDKDLKYTLVVNPQMGLTELDMLGKTDYDFLSKEDADKLTTVKTRVMETGEAFHFETSLISASGKEEFFDGDYIPTFDAHNEANGLIGYFRNVTEHKQYEEKLIRSEHKLAEAERIGNSGSWEYDVASDTAVWSENMFRLFDVDPKTPTELVFTHFIENLLHPDDRQEILSVFTDALSGKRPYDLNYRIIKKNGSIRTIHAIAETFFDETSNAIRMMGKVEDITERKVAEEALIESEVLYRSLLSNLEAGVVVHAPDTSIIMNNVRASELLGLTDDQMKGKKAIDPAWKFVKEDGFPLPLSEYPINLIANSKKPIKNLIVGVSQPGKNDIVWLTVNGFPVVKNNGEISEIVISFNDITERKQAENDIEMMNSLNADMNKGMSLDYLIDKSKMMIINAFYANHADIYLADPDSMFLTVKKDEVKKEYLSAFEKILPFKIPEEIKLSLHGDNWYSKVFNERKIRITENTADIESMIMAFVESNFPSAPFKQHLSKIIAFFKDINSIVSVPLILSQQNIALMDINFKTRPTEKDIKRIEKFAEQLVVIINRKQSEAKINESEEKYRSLVDNTDIGFVVIDENGKVVSANEPYKKLAGFAINEVITGRSVIEWTAPDEKENNANAVALCTKQGFVNDFETVYQHSDGTRINITVDASIYKSPKGNHQIVSYCRDITERKVISGVQEFLLKCGHPGSGENFFDSLAKFLSKELTMEYVCIDKLKGDGLTAQTLSIYNGGKYETNVSYALKETPCGEVVGKTICCFPENVCNMFPHDQALQDLNAESYLGTTLWSFDGRPIGLIALIGQKPLKNRRLAEASLKQVAMRAAAELERKQAEDELKELLKKQEASKMASLNLLQDIKKEMQERMRAEEEIQKLNATLELRVAERTAQLEAANKEQEAFSYSVSHDLRGPLRRVHGFTQILQEDYADKFDEEGKKLCNSITENTQKMGVLIDELLAFAQLSRTDMQCSVINMKEVIDAVYLDVTNSESRERITLCIDNICNVTVDAQMIKHVWTNLLSNAIKYSSKKEKAIISISCKNENGQCVYCIKDNGVGFDMSYVNKLFGVFERLHSEKEFEGTGVGLAIVKRIVQRHGGKVWAESAVNEGASFYFSLPNV